jgi:putative nucleotidyltransferase with HDIG domain
MNRLRILIAGGTDKDRHGFRSFLAGLECDVETSPGLPGAASPDGAENPYSLIIVPWSEKPGLRGLRTAFPSASVVVLAGASGSRALMPLLREGIIDHVASPDHPAALYSAVRAGLAGRQSAHENECLVRNLAKMKLEQARSLRRAMALEEIYDSTVENLMMALDLRDVETFGHSQTVAKYSQVLAGILGIREKSLLDSIRRGALLHDVGKIAIPDSILKKPGPLTPQEWDKVRLHPSLGYGLVKEIKLVREAGNIILYHHEKFDGSGYPEGLKRKEIPLEARIFALADALDAITSRRPYRRERDFAAARREIRRNSGHHFDPAIVEAFDGLPVERWEKIRYETTRLLPAFIDFSRAATGK